MWVRGCEVAVRAKKRLPEVNESQGGTEDFELLFREPSFGDAE